MKPYLKNMVIPSVSAVIGGIAVVAALKISPELRSNLDSSTSNKQGESRGQVYDNMIKEQNGIYHHFNDLFNEELFGRADPLAEMKQMREQMEKRMKEFESHSPSITNPFDSWVTNKFGGGSINEISKREDDDYIYYDIQIDKVKSTSISTRVENGYLTITGTQEQKTGSVDESDGDNSNGESYLKSTFNRTFPIPEYVDPNKMEMLPEKDKIVLKFLKVKA